MSPERDRLRSPVDASLDEHVQGQQEIIDAETVAKLDAARLEPGDDIPLEELRRGRAL